MNEAKQKKISWYTTTVTALVTCVVTVLIFLHTCRVSSKNEFIASVDPVVRLVLVDSKDYPGLFPQNLELIPAWQVTNPSQYPIRNVEVIAKVFSGDKCIGAMCGILGSIAPNTTVDIPMAGVFGLNRKSLRSDLTLRQATVRFERNIEGSSMHEHQVQNAITETMPHYAGGMLTDTLFGLQLKHVSPATDETAIVSYPKGDKYVSYHATRTIRRNSDGTITDVLADLDIEYNRHSKCFEVSFIDDAGRKNNAGQYCGIIE